MYKELGELIIGVHVGQYMFTGVRNAQIKTSPKINITGGKIFFIFKNIVLQPSIILKDKSNDCKR